MPKQGKYLQKIFHEILSKIVLLGIIYAVLEDVSTNDKLNGYN